jgi:hypothetical protein
MPNSDTQDGVHNKITKEIRYYRTANDDGAEEVVTQSFSGNVETAKSAILHADALTSNDTNGTQLEYAITADGNGLKFTIAFGTKGTAGIAESDDWADTWTTTKDSLIAADKWVKPSTYILTDDAGEDVTMDAGWKAIDATPHLF